MHRENRREAASAHRNRIHYETRQYFYNQHDLIRGTESRVDELAVYRTGHRMHRCSFVADDNGHGCHRFGHGEEERPALHDHRAESGDKATNLRVPQHYILIVRPVNHPPVRLHVQHAFADIVAARKKQPIINRAHDPVAQRTHRAQLHLNVFFFQRHV